MLARVHCRRISRALAVVAPPFDDLLWTPCGPPDDPVTSVLDSGSSLGLSGSEAHGRLHLTDDSPPDPLQTPPAPAA
eukprot:5046132-Pyramimonas_sp.AAC.1